jgi:hypothetical protein
MKKSDVVLENRHDRYLSTFLRLRKILSPDKLMIQMTDRLGAISLAAGFDLRGLAGAADPG